MLEFLVEFFGTPAIVLGTIALIGLLIQRKAAGAVISGTLKTILGYLIMVAGAVTIVGALGPVTTMFTEAFGITGFVTYDEGVVAAVSAATPALAREIALVILFGFIIHLILARVTPWKYVYLTGHMIWIHAGAFAILFHTLGFPTLWVVILASIVDGIYMTTFPAMIQPFMRMVTGTDDIAFGHGQTLLNVLCAIAGKPPLGNPKVSAEEIKVPEGLAFFRDMAISMSLVMLIVAIPAALLMGPGRVEAELSAGKHWLIFAILQALGFTAGVLVLIQGVRMLIAEIVPAFKGFADAIIPGARPALDCPVIYPYAPMSLLIGMVIGVIAQFIAMVILGAIGWPVPLPSMIVAFFASGSGAIFGNATGGRRGAIIGGFLWSFVCFFMVSYAYMAKIFGDLGALGAVGLGFTCPDAIVPAIIIKWIATLFGVGR